MKQVLIILFVMLIMFSCDGCVSGKEISETESETSPSENFLEEEQEETSEGEFAEQEGNNLFTDQFFEDVVIINCMPAGVVTGEQVEPVIEFLEGLTLTETDEHINFEDENGETLIRFFYITFRKSNNYEITFYMDGYGTFTYKSTTTLVDTFSYTAGENIINELKAAFARGREIG